MALIISNIAIIFTNLTIKEAFETDIQLNEEVKRMELDGAFCKIFQILLDKFFLISSQNVENRQRKWPIKRKIGVTKRPRPLNPRKVIAIAICSIIVHFTI